MQYTMAEDPYAVEDDGTPKDPKAFQSALRADSTKMATLEDEAETKAIVLGDDMHAFQELIRGVYQVLILAVDIEHTMTVMNPDANAIANH